MKLLILTLLLLISPFVRAIEIGAGAFTMTDDAGRTVTERTLADGTYHLIFFGFAHCADICPASLSMMAAMYQGLPLAQQSKLKVVFVTVDPDRDTAAKLGEFVRGFNPSFVAWRGTKTQTDVLVKNFLAYAAVTKDAKAPGGVQVDHSGFMYLMGPDGKYVTHVGSSDSLEVIQNRISAAIK